MEEIPWPVSNEHEAGSWVFAVFVRRRLSQWDK